MPSALFYAVVQGFSQRKISKQGKARARLHYFFIIWQGKASSFIICPCLIQKKSMGQVITLPRLTCLRAFWNNPAVVMPFLRKHFSEEIGGVFVTSLVKGSAAAKSKLVHQNDLILKV